MTTQFSRWCYHHLEASLLPCRPQKKWFSYPCKALKFLLLLPLFFFSQLLRVLSFKKKESPLQNFSKKPVWDSPFSIKTPIALGFSTCDFQDHGPLAHPHTNWGDFYKDKAHLTSLMPAMWENPERIIAYLKELGIKKYRFSLSRDRLQPELGKTFNRESLDRYTRFCRALIHEEIEPMVTLHHFSEPLYFSWEREEDISLFIDYAISTSHLLYQAGVRKILTFNEPSVFAFQGWVRGEFPPYKKLDFEGAGRVITRMLEAHTKIYTRLKKELPDLEIGLTHDPIRFHPFHRFHPLWSPLERLLCKYLTTLTHTALLNALKTGLFSLKIPFFANYTHDLKKKPPLDFIGLQYYTDPLIKLSFWKGESVVACPEEKMTAYGYRTFPQGLASALSELATLGKPIELTEIGIDIGIDSDETDCQRILYFEKIFQVVELALQQKIPIRSLYFWTLIDNLEWYKAWEIRFGFYSFNPKTGKITPRPIVSWLKNKNLSL